MRGKTEITLQCDEEIEGFLPVNFMQTYLRQKQHTILYLQF